MAQLIVSKPYSNLTVSPFRGVDPSKFHEGSDNFIRASPGTRRVLEVLNHVRNKDREFGFARKIPGSPLRQFQLGHLNFRKALGWDSTTARHVRSVLIITRAIPKKARLTFIHNEIWTIPRNKRISTGCREDD
jgi:hypothetical protein